MFEKFNNEVGAGLSGKEKKIKKQEERQIRLREKRERQQRGEMYGDLKVSRRIPKELAEIVANRDIGRDFGRPDHSCERPGPPHHITHFEQYLNGEAQGNPHTVDNLEAPCKECHNLAHAMHIPSGVSIETFFRENDWRR